MKSLIQHTGVIVPPRRLSISGAIIVLSTVALLSLAFAFSGIGVNLRFAILGILLGLAIIGRAAYAIHAVLLASLLLILVPLFPIFHVWPLTLFGPLIIYGAVVFIIPPLRHSVGWIRRGYLDAGVIKLIMVTVFVSSLSLIGWVAWLKPDLRRYLASIPDMPFWAYPVAGIGFALFNSAMEECIFRGIFMEAIDSALGPGYWSVGFQAVPFAALHYIAGFPNGRLGFLMVLIYGVLLGTVRRISKGLFAPVMTHLAADMTIFSILAFILYKYGGAWG